MSCPNAVLGDENIYVKEIDKCYKSVFSSRNQFLNLYQPRKGPKTETFEEEQSWFLSSCWESCSLF